ncbi:hypothetical protein [Glycomyces sp. NPDC021274]|uniref:hypothetical protein n=1 Tax=Glycomyces sp. NPDC021274 TaxID=3155120 RepID=UPI0033FB0985
MDPTNVDNVGGIGAAWVTINLVVVIAVVLGLVYGVLVVMAALGLTSFSVFERFRKKRPEEAEDGGIDDLF